MFLLFRCWCVINVVWVRAGVGRYVGHFVGLLGECRVPVVYCSVCNVSREDGPWTSTVGFITGERFECHVRGFVGEEGAWWVCYVKMLCGVDLDEEDGGGCDAVLEFRVLWGEEDKVVASEDEEGVIGGDECCS